MALCPVCQEYIKADDTAFEFHVNSHFDTEGEAAAAAASGQTFDSAWKEDKFTDHVPMESPAEVDDKKECPICQYPLDSLTQDQAQRHVMGCLGTLPLPPLASS